MEDHRNNSEPQEEQLPRFRGLYRNVKISVKALDRVIFVCIAVIFIVVAMELRNPGFTITYDSCGGTDVMANNQMYGELLEEPEPPTREGYLFTGWYKDSACYELWDVNNDIIESEVIL